VIPQRSAKKPIEIASVVVLHAVCPPDTHLLLLYEWWLRTDLFQGLAGQMGFSHRQRVLLLSQGTHFTVRLPVVQSHRRQIVKRLVQIGLHVHCPQPNYQ